MTATLVPRSLDELEAAGWDRWGDHVVCRLPAWPAATRYVRVYDDGDVTLNGTRVTTTDLGRACAFAMTLVRMIEAVEGWAAE